MGTFSRPFTRKCEQNQQIKEFERRNLRLASLCLVEVTIGGRPSYNQVPTPRDDVRRLFKAGSVAIPAALPLAPARAATRQKLPQRRKVK